MRILFVYPGSISRNEQPLGIMYISAVLKQHGHETSLFRLVPGDDVRFDLKVGEIKVKLENKIVSFQPDLIGFSVISTVFRRSLILAEFIKQKSEAKIIFGGAHPTVDPDNTIGKGPIDMVCVGEGEYAMLELVTNMEHGGDIRNIKNICVKEDGTIWRNDVRPLFKDLDCLPHPDRDLLHNDYLNGEIKRASFITSRGCPYQCAYCHNPFLQELYRGKGPFVRYRSIEDVINEIKEVIYNYGILGVTFSDDTFSLKRQRIIDFCAAYEKEIGLPFLCQTRANHLDEAVLSALKKAGCEEVHIGIESGNDYLRNQVLHRNMDRKDIISAFTLAKKIGVKTASFNLIGGPFETEETIWETIDINREVKPNLTVHTIPMPFEKSSLRQLCIENGWPIKPIEDWGSYYTTSVFEQPSISSKKLIAYQHLFDLYVYAPKFYFPFLHVLRFLWQFVPEGRKLQHRLFRSLLYQMTQFMRKLCLKSGV